jgi:hypothetical protein
VLEGGQYRPRTMFALARGHQGPARA